MIYSLSRKQSKLLTIGILSLFFVVCIILMPSRAPKFVSMPSTSVESVELQGRQVVMNEFHRSETKDGKTIWEIHAKQGAYDPIKGSAQLNEPRIKFYREDGTIVDLVSRSGDVGLESSVLSSARMKGDVVISSNKGTTIRTEEAHYDRTAQTVFAPGRVSITTATFDVTGEEMRSNLETEELRFARNVTTIIKPSVLEPAGAQSADARR